MTREQYDAAVCKLLQSAYGGGNQYRRMLERQYPSSSAESILEAHFRGVDATPMRLESSVRSLGLNLRMVGGQRAWYAGDVDALVHHLAVERTGCLTLSAQNADEAAQELHEFVWGSSWNRVVWLRRLLKLELAVDWELRRLPLVWAQVLALDMPPGYVEEKFGASSVPSFKAERLACVRQLAEHDEELVQRLHYASDDLRRRRVAAARGQRLPDAIRNTVAALDRRLNAELHGGPDAN